MSLINQMLSDLEKRGAGGIPGESAIRPVSVQTGGRKLVLSLTGILTVLIFVVAGLMWAISLRKSVAPESHPTLYVAQPTGQRDAATQVQIQSTIQPQITALQVRDAPAMHLSTELSTLPLLSVAATTPVRENAPIISATVAAAPHPVILKEQQVPSATAGGSDRNKVVLSPPANTTPHGSVDKQIKPLSVQQQAENEFRKANLLMQQGRTGEAIAGYDAALQLDVGHETARQAMVGLLLESKRNADAESVLQAGLNYNPKHSGFAMLLARLQVERGALPQALETLQKTLPFAAQQADYQAFIAAVQQRMGQHKDAVEHYQVALQASPNSAIWLMGLGISLKALQQKDAARVAFKHALESHTLDADLQAFVTQQLKEL